MLLLAEALLYNDPPAFYLYFTPRSTISKRLTWYGFAFNTEKCYTTTINSYTSFCVLYNKKIWPASIIMLEKWVVTQICGLTLSKSGQIKSDIILNYLSILKFYHIYRCLNLRNFNNLQITLIIKDGKKLVPGKKQNHFSITRNIFK